MKTVKILIFLLFGGLLAFLTWAYFLPANVHIEEKVKINSPTSIVFEQVNNLHNWKNWSLWNDSTLTTVFEGPESGLGAKLITLDPKEGKSVQTIIESQNQKLVVTKLVFNKENNEAKSYFYFETIGNETEVKWVMDVEDLSFPFGRFVGYMIKKGASINFAKGLNTMKTYLESNPIIQTESGYIIKDEMIDSKFYISYVDSGYINELSDKIQHSMGVLNENLNDLNIKSCGPSVVEWNSFNPDGISSFRSLLPIDTSMQEKPIFYTIPKGRTIWLQHIGSYEASAAAWNALDLYMKNHQLEMRSSPYEEYLVSPEMESDTSRWITNIYFPVSDK